MFLIFMTHWKSHLSTNVSKGLDGKHLDSATLVSVWHMSTHQSYLPQNKHNMIDADENCIRINFRIEMERDHNQHTVQKGATHQGRKTKG